MCVFWRSVLMVYLVWSWSVVDASAIEWNQFRGPNGQGVMVVFEAGDGVFVRVWGVGTLHNVEYIHLSFSRWPRR